jgi:hypothetical protein
MNEKGRDAETLLAMMTRFGYQLKVPHLKTLTHHLSNLDGRGTDWTPGYLRAIAKGQLQASARVLDAIERCDRFPPPDPEANSYSIPTLVCECGTRFVPNRTDRSFCYVCRPVRHRKGHIGT